MNPWAILRYGGPMPPRDLTEEELEECAKAVEEKRIGKFGKQTEMNKKKQGWARRFNFLLDPDYCAGSKGPQNKDA